MCWGNNPVGELGDGTTTNESTPVTVTAVTNAASVTLGINYSCELDSDGAAECWGHNSYGQLGNNSTSNSSVPVAVMPF